MWKLTEQPHSHWPIVPFSLRRGLAFQLSFCFASDDNILSFPWVISVDHIRSRKFISFSSDYPKLVRVRLKWQLTMKPEGHPNFHTSAYIGYKCALLRWRKWGWVGMFKHLLKMIMCVMCVCVYLYPCLWTWRSQERIKGVSLCFCFIPLWQDFSLNLKLTGLARTTGLEAPYSTFPLPLNSGVTGMCSHA